MGLRVDHLRGMNHRIYCVSLWMAIAPYAPRLNHKRAQGSPEGGKWRWKQSAYNGAIEHDIHTARLAFA